MKKKIIILKYSSTLYSYFKNIYQNNNSKKGILLNKEKEFILQHFTLRKIQAVYGKKCNFVNILHSAFLIIHCFYDTFLNTRKFN